MIVVSQPASQSDSCRATPNINTRLLARVNAADHIHRKDQRGALAILVPGTVNLGSGRGVVGSMDAAAMVILNLSCECYLVE